MASTKLETAKTAALASVLVAAGWLGNSWVGPSDESIGNLTSVSDLADAVNAPGTFRLIRFQDPRSEPVIMGDSWMKTYADQNGDSMVVAKWPLASPVMLRLKPTHVIALSDPRDPSRDVDYWYGRLPELYPTSNDTLDWWLYDMRASMTEPAYGGALFIGLTPDCFAGTSTPWDDGQ